MRTTVIKATGEADVCCAPKFSVSNLLDHIEFQQIQGHEEWQKISMTDKSMGHL